MCELKKYHGTSNTQIDKCMKPLIKWLNRYEQYVIRACCCGHGKYPMTIIVTNLRFKHWELLSDTLIPRERRFYKKDKQGYYYIPEVSK